MDAASTVEETPETVQPSAEASPSLWVPKPDDLVFAKVKGYSYWPARVLANNSEKLKGGIGKYTVFFFGTYETAFVTAKDIVPYKENRDKYGNVKKKKFAIALKEIEETPDIDGNPSRVISETIECENSNADSNSNSVDAPNIETPLVIAEAKVNGNKSVNGDGKKKGGGSRKRKVSVNTEGSDAKKTRKRGRKAAAAKESSSQVESNANLTDITNEGNKNNKLVEIVNEVSTNASGDNDLINPCKLAKLREKLTEKEKLKEQLKLEKLLKKRQERLEKIKMLPVTETLLKDIETEIMESLAVDKTDIPRCLLALSRLDILQVTTQSLCSYPNILNTIKSCRKYKFDEKVRQKSNYLYNKFKLLFANGVDEFSLSKGLPASNNSRNQSPEPSPVAENQTTLPDSTSDANESEQPVSSSVPDQAVSSSLTSPPL